MVSHVTVHGSADLLFSVKVIWESGIDLARLVECLYLFRREHACVCVGALERRQLAHNSDCGGLFPAPGAKGQVSHGSQFLLPCADGTKLLRKGR